MVVMSRSNVVTSCGEIIDNSNVERKKITHNNASHAAYGTALILNKILFIHKQFD